MEHEARNALAALRLQFEWGVDEALVDAPIDRRHPARIAAPRLPASLFGPGDGPAADRSPTPPSPSRTLPQEAARQAALAAASLPALRLALEASDQCELRHTATHLVFASQPNQARVMLVGDTPGAEDDRTGEPFAGPHGAYLDRILASAGLDRQTVRLAHLVPWRPPGGRPASEAEIAIGLPFLRREIELTGPAYLLIVSGPAFTALAGDPGRRLKRNKAPEFTNVSIDGGLTIPALCVPSLAAIRRSAACRRECWAKLTLLRNSLDGL